MAKHYLLVEINTSGNERTIEGEQRTVQRVIHHAFGPELARVYAAEEITALNTEAFAIRNRLHYDAVMDDGNPPPGYVPEQ